MTTQARTDATLETPGQHLLRMAMDRRLLVIALFLMAIGVSLVLSSSSFFAGGKFGDHFILMRNHATRCIIAVAALLFASRVDYRVYRKSAPMLFLFGLILMSAVFVFGVAFRRSLRWIPFPLINATLQPSEIARTTLVFFLAYWVTRSGTDIRNFKRGFLPAALAIITVAGMAAAMPNFGTATATIMISLVVLYAGGARLVHITGFMGVGASLAAFGFMRYAYIHDRVMSFLGRGDGPEIGWQVNQSLIALGSGGLFGVGFGHSEQKLNWLPDAYTDFIFSIVGEEGGLLLTLLVSGMFLALSLRALKISYECSDRFGQVLGVGISASVFIYAMLNMFVVTGLFPVTGLPLPFLSYGGSALVVNGFAVGVLLNLSRRHVASRRDARKRWTACAPLSIR
jgi:cell division protein FtsW